MGSKIATPGFTDYQILAVEFREPCVDSSYMHGMEFSKIFVRILAWLPGASTALFLLVR
jgi:hypothetical protein